MVMKWITVVTVVLIRMVMTCACSPSRLVELKTILQGVGDDEDDSEDVDGDDDSGDDEDDSDSDDGGGDSDDGGGDDDCGTGGAASQPRFVMMMMKMKKSLSVCADQDVGPTIKDL